MHDVILDHVTFSDMAHYRSGSKAKLTSTNRSCHFYFNRIARLYAWNALHPIDISLSLPTIKLRLQHFFWSHFWDHFDPDDLGSFHVICPCSRGIRRGGEEETESNGQKDTESERDIEVRVFETVKVIMHACIQIRTYSDMAPTLLH